MAGWLAQGTVGDMLYNMNRPEAIELAHQPNIGYFAPIVHGDDHAGADAVATSWPTIRISAWWIPRRSCASPAASATGGAARTRGSRPRAPSRSTADRVR